uniref:Myb-like domain-containing protein n=1 Tax=Trichobilharzia regenti TaxID=157069 RepID=A0AA85K450_TRIRE|nr:unnamed protein product [Trichobilharzia regenti]
MPKVFRPSIKQVKSQVKTNEQETQKNDSKEVVDAPPVTEPPSCTVPSEPINSPHLVSECVSENPETEDQRPTDLDSEVSVNGEKSQPSGELVNLFVTKKPRRVKTKITEAIPPVDQPLDRSSVTLRSLLHWVPINKPPPTYRQDRLDSTTCSVNGDAEASNKTQEDNFANIEVKETSPKIAPSDAYLDPLAPQLRIDANGNIVLDETSLLIKKSENLDMKNLRHINEETGVLNVNYNSFRPPRDCHAKRWTERETTRFYRALSTIGTDFYVMEKMFPRRKRSELVNKFKREEKRNPYLVNQALRNRRTYDLINLLPSSDEENDEKSEKPSKNSKRKNKCGQDSTTCSDQSSEKCPNESGKSKSKRRKSSVLCPDPYFEDRLSDTIDFVLSQYANSNSSNHESDSTEQITDEQQNIKKITHRYGLRRSSRNIPTLEKMISAKEAELAASRENKDKCDLDLPLQSSPTDKHLSSCPKTVVPKHPKSYFPPKVNLFKFKDSILGES